MQTIGQVDAVKTKDLFNLTKPAYAGSVVAKVKTKETPTETQSTRKQSIMGSIQKHRAEHGRVMQRTQQDRTLNIFEDNSNRD